MFVVFMKSLIIYYNELKVGVIYVFFYVIGFLMLKIIEYDFCIYGFGY